MGNLMVLEATLQDSLSGILGDAAAVLASLENGQTPPQ